MTLLHELDAHLPPCGGEWNFLGLASSLSLRNSKRGDVTGTISVQSTWPPPPLIPPHKGRETTDRSAHKYIGSRTSLPLVGRVAQLGEAVAKLGGGGHSRDANDSNALREFRTILSPPLAPMRIYARPLHRSEIMTSGWCGGDRVGWQSCCLRPKLRPAGLHHSQAAVLTPGRSM